MYSIAWDMPCGLPKPGANIVSKGVSGFGGAGVLEVIEDYT